MATQLRFLLNLAAVLLLDNSIRAEAPTEELCNSSRQVLAAVRAIGREQWVYVEKLETGPALRILVERKDADPDDLVKVDIEVHVSALPAIEGYRASVESKRPCLLPSPGGSSPSLLLNGEPISDCPRLPCVVNTSCSLGRAHPHRLALLKGEGENQNLTAFRYEMESDRLKWARLRATAAEVGTSPDAAQAAAVSADTAPEDAAPVAVARGEWEDGAHYVEILYPPDGACLADAAHAYISIAITDKFFTLRGSDALRVRSEAVVKCAQRPGAAPVPAREDYDARRDGALVPCWQYESDVQVAGGVARAWRAGGSGAAVQGMHDCPAGEVCSHDLEDGFMLDVHLAPPEGRRPLPRAPVSPRSNCMRFCPRVRTACASRCGRGGTRGQ
jgi:hypothetical protein